MNTLPISTPDSPPKMHYISVSRGHIPFGPEDKISAIDTTPTHPAYQGNHQIYGATDSAFVGFLDRPEAYLDQAKRAVLVINGRPSIPEPHFTEQTAEEVNLMQKLVAKLLGVRTRSILPFSKFGDNDQGLSIHEQYKELRKRQESLSFLVSKRTYNKILQNLGFSRDSSLEEIQHENPLFSEGGAIAVGVKVDGNTLICIQ